MNTTGLKIDFEEKQNPRRYRAVNSALTKQDDLYYISSWQPSRAQCLAQIKKEKKENA